MGLVTSRLTATPLPVACGKPRALSALEVAWGATRSAISRIDQSVRSLRQTLRTQRRIDQSDRPVSQILRTLPCSDESDRSLRQTLRTLRRIH